jgi:diaminohydroxyphosphoribosylaminopyrimidine deaminase / 5-amino-6-(5-phosphoribosylamino)uracil reductase
MCLLCRHVVVELTIANCIIWQVYAFWAPKIIGGLNAPTPVGELGMSQMTQAINLIDVSYEQVNIFSSSDTHYIKSMKLK